MRRLLERNCAAADSDRPPHVLRDSSAYGQVEKASVSVTAGAGLPGDLE